MDNYKKELAEFGVRVGDERRRLRLNQTDAAKAIGISRPALSYIESGTRFMNQFELAKMAKLYRISVDSLLDN